MIPRLRRYALLAFCGLAAVAQAQAQAQDPALPPSDSAPAASAETPPSPPLTWVPKGVAELQALDKVNARQETLTVKVGDQAQYGSLRIAVQACMVRPPSQPQDAASFLTITDANAGDGPVFRAWMFAKEPSLSMLQHPVYDIRVIGCH